MGTDDMMMTGIDNGGCGASERRMLIECAVAGVSYRVAPDSGIWDELEPGSKLTLVRERGNVHDYNAVALTLDDGYDYGEECGMIIGYIPRTENYIVASMFDLGWGELLEAEVSEVRREGPMNDRLRLAVYIRSRARVEAPESRPVVLLGLDSGEYGRMTDELRRSGLAVFFRGSFGDGGGMVEAGDEIVAVSRGVNGAAIYMLRVFAAGEECKGLMETAEGEDDMIVVTCVAGPLAVGEEELSKLGLPTPDEYRQGVAITLRKEVARRVKECIDSRVARWEEYAERGWGKGRKDGPQTAEEVVEWIEDRALRFYYRDADTAGEEWTVGDMICPEFDVEVSDRFLRPVADTRFVIATSRANELFDNEATENRESGEKARRWRLATIDASSLMMVADIYQPEGSGVRQVLLVHLPPEAADLERTELLEAVSKVKGPHLYIHGLITAARQDLGTKLRSAPLPRQYDEELTSLLRRPLRRPPE